MGRTPRDKRRPREIKSKRKTSVIVSREEWGAKEPPAEGRSPLQLPVYKVMVKYYTGTPACATREECCESMRLLQEQHVAQGLPDIPYNFCIGGDDQIYEGRGWFNAPQKVDGDLAKWENLSLDIAYIGQSKAGFNMTNGCADLLTFGILKKCIVGMFDYEVIAEKVDVPTELRSVLRVHENSENIFLPEIPGEFEPKEIQPVKSLLDQLNEGIRPT